jgi:hypothetical protein
MQNPFITEKPMRSVGPSEPGEGSTLLSPEGKKPQHSASSKSVTSYATFQISYPPERCSEHEIKEKTVIPSAKIPHPDTSNQEITNVHGVNAFKDQ